MRTFSTFYLWLAAYPLGPFIGAGRGVARPTRFPVFPARREDVRTPHEEPPEKRHLISRRGRRRHGWLVIRVCRGIVGVKQRLTPTLDRGKALLKLCPFGIQLGKLGSNMGNFLSLGIGHRYQRLTMSTHAHFLGITGTALNASIMLRIPSPRPAAPGAVDTGADRSHERRVGPGSRTPSRSQIRT